MSETDSGNEPGGKATRKTTIKMHGKKRKHWCLITANKTEGEVQIYATFLVRLGDIVDSLTLI